MASGGYFAAFELLYIRRDLAKMEKEVAPLLELLEKLATEAGATKPISAETIAKGSGFLAGKMKALSFGKKDTEVVDYSADHRASYMMIKGAILRAMNKVSIEILFLFACSLLIRGLVE